MRSMVVVSLLLACSKSPPRKDDAPPTPGGADAAAAAARCDMSSDEAVNRAYEQASGQDAPGCLARPASFPELAVLGDAVPDRGCATTAVLYRCKAARSTAEVAAQVMADAGWGAADKRQALALAWVREVENAFGGGMLEAETPEFAMAGKQFAAPSAIVEPGGGLVVDLWLSATGGMMEGTSYRRVQYRFTPAGEVADRKGVDNFHHSNARGAAPQGCDLAALGLANAAQVRPWTPPAACEAKGGPQGTTTITDEKQFAAAFTCTGGAGSGLDFTRNQLVVQHRSRSPASVGGQIVDDGKKITYVSHQRTTCPNDPRPMPTPHTVIFLRPAGTTRTFADAACTIPGPPCK